VFKAMFTMTLMAHNCSVLFCNFYNRTTCLRTGLVCGRLNSQSASEAAGIPSVPCAASVPSPSS
jgi:hypothetical protein